MSESPLLKRWHLYQEKVDALKPRERALVLFTVLAVVYFLWDAVIFNPLASVKVDVDKEVVTIEQKIFTMEQEEKAILSAVNADPDRDLKQQIAILEQELGQLNDSLAELSLGLVPVDQLAEILHDVLLNTNKLQLVNLRTLPVEAISLTATDSPPSENSADVDGMNTAGVYKHKVALTVKGDFRELMDYLAALETMNWRFYWDELHFEEERYPDAVIQLHVYTLSTDEGLFGV